MPQYPRLRSVIVSCLLCLAFTASAQTIPAVDALVQRHAEAGDLHGAVLAAEAGEIVHESACGLADASWDIPNTPDTRFKIYSMTKQFTAVLVLQQAAAGTIDLDATIVDYLDWYPDDPGRRVTIHQLLCHTHGIPGPAPGVMPYLVEEPTDVAITRYFSQQPRFEPGSRFEYSGLAGYTILGAVLEAVTGRTYQELLREKILEPAGMNDTIYLDYHAVVPGKAEDYVPGEHGLEPRWQTYFAHANGASSMVSTVRDLLRWDRALRGDLLLPPAWRDRLFTTQVELPSGEHSYGYGFYLWTIDEGPRAGRYAHHGGGGSCLIIRGLDVDRTVIMLNNIWVSQLAEIGMRIMQAMDGDS